MNTNNPYQPLTAKYLIWEKIQELSTESKKSQIIADRYQDNVIRKNAQIESLQDSLDSLHNQPIKSDNDL